MAEKRIIEQVASTEVYNDDWLVKDSVTQGTTKILISRLKEYFNDGQATEADLKEIIDDIAPEFDSTESYSEGDIVIYENVLYIFTDDKAAGNWDDTKVDSTSIADLIKDVQAEIDGIDEAVTALEAELPNKADKDGVYDMVAGNIKSDSYEADNAPYNYRASHSGSAVEDKIVGGTVAWNQLCLLRSDFSGNGITLTSNSDGSYNVNGTAEARTIITFGVTFMVYQNHKYYIKGCPSGGSSNTYYFGLAGYVSETGNGAIFNYPSTTSLQNARLDIQSGANISNTKIIPQVIDLTQMFGSTIADYIYSLEQATAGAGVAYFRNLFPKDYYAYDAGSLQSVNTSGKKVYDSNNTLRVTYPLDSDLTLRGIPKLDSNNNLYYDGDTYESDGKVTRRFGVVNLGSLSYTYYSTADGNLFRATISDMVTTMGTTLNALCPKYIAVPQSNRTNGTITSSANTKNIDIIDNNYTDASTFKTAMNGVYLVYELVTSTTETADAFENPQIVFGGGTEEYIDERAVAVPVGHDSKYQSLPNFLTTDVMQGILKTEYASYSSSASKLTNTSKIGDTNQPVYFTASGTPTPINYTIAKSVPSDAVFTDANVTQTAISSSDSYRVLFGGANDTATTAGVSKSNKLVFNPAYGNLNVSNDGSEVASTNPCISVATQSGSVSMFTSDIENSNLWAGESMSLNTVLTGFGTDIGNIQTNLSDYIKIRNVYRHNSTITQGVDLSREVEIALPNGYKFLCWMPTGTSSGWVAGFPIYLSKVNMASGNVYWNGTLDSGNECGVNFWFLAIRDI